jgi:hypothetical protein
MTMPHLVRVLIRADQIAQRYSVRPSTLLGITDQHAAWCIDEAAAIAGNMQDERDQKNAESNTGNQHRTANSNEPEYPYIGTERGMPVIRGKIPIIPPPAPRG